ncbi:MAG: transporter substrate-binding domain-containing protein, partial [Desulfamplus sp.]|nr:transporter substrate-binding domain-containing protein [Desulfamplus sp.]
SFNISFAHPTQNIDAKEDLNSGNISNSANIPNSVKLTDLEKEWIKAHPVIRLAPDPEFQPIEFFDENGNYTGIGADYVRLIEQKLGIKFQIVRCKNWDEVIERAKNREVDVLGNAVKTPQREEYLLFPTPYLKIPSVIIVRNKVTANLTFEMLKGMNVVMVSGYGYVDLIRNKYPEINIELLPDLKSALRKVSFGMADAFVGDLATASFYIESEGISNLRLAGETEPPNISGFAVRSDWLELSEILEKGIALLTEEEQKEIFSRWIRLGAEPGVTMAQLKKIILIIISIVFIIIVIFLFWNRMLQSVVRLKTEDLRKEIEERKHAESALIKSEAHLRALIKTIPDLVWFKDIDGIYLACNLKFENFVNMEEKDVIGKTDYDLVPKEMADIYRRDDKISMEQRTIFIREEQLTYHDGHTEIVETIKTPFYGSDGHVIGVLGIARDITERKKAEEERQKLQEQLFQARKMDAIGHLAGGVAHDFNNMLSIIIGRTELARLSISVSDPLYNSLFEIESVAKRSADLTNQLLAFARKQTIAPQVINLNNSIEEMLNMLRRLIGEDIEFVWRPFSELFLVKMDTAQLDQVFANLIINARDAIINGGGKIIIETNNVIVDNSYCELNSCSIPGEYVVMAVSDNGCGMDKKTLDNIFEPFFTTKELGKGTGLGLATIYGIVKQNGGFINVYSELGSGTTFRIYLPRIYDEENQRELASYEIVDKEAMGGTETILLVEDESAILEVSQVMLEMLGYNVIAADRPDEAIRLANDYKGEIDLLITDVIMPEMNGQEVANKLRSIFPDIKLMFMSGYTANVISHHGVLDSGVNFIQKPFSMKELAEKVRWTILT